MNMAKIRVFMEVADKIAELGTCPRKAVGAVLIRDGRCISWGYNGAPPGFPHCEENDHGYSDLEGRILHPRTSENDGCRNVTHAEANALAFAARQGISTNDSILFVSVSPCDVCSRLLIAAGVKVVYYRELYRDPSGLYALHQANMVTERVCPPVE